jgi:hypothetical protein
VPRCGFEGFQGIERRKVWAHRTTSLEKLGQARETMLCGKVPRNIIEQLQQSISRDFDFELVEVNPVQRHLVLPPKRRRGKVINQTQDRRPPARAAGSAGPSGGGSAPPCAISPRIHICSTTLA